MNQDVSYLAWDYTTRGYIPQELNKSIKQLITTENSDNIKKFFSWLSDNHKDFAFMYRDTLISHLLECQHFEIVEELFNKKTFKFDEKIAIQCAFTLSLHFEEKTFDYWIKKVQQLDMHSQSSTYKKFWHEFFSYQFLRSEEVMQNISNLEYVFDKAPFYTESEYDIVNSYFMKAREDFFKNRFSNLDKQLKPVILQKLAILCGVHYPHFKSTFEEEFQNFPEIFESFEKAQLYKKLHDKFDNKPSRKQIKI